MAFVDKVGEGGAIPLRPGAPPEELVIEVLGEGEEFRPQIEEEEPFDVNLAEVLDEGVLDSLALELIESVDNDKHSRKDWEENLAEFVDELGFKYQDEHDEPFPGACKAAHPLLAESIVSFQSKSSVELFPPGGPVKTVIYGVKNDEVEAQAKRVREYMNYQLTELMPEYSKETERMLFYLGFTGSAFKKVYFDQVLGRPVIRFVSSADFIIDYDASDLKTAERYTHELTLNENEMRKSQNVGLYADVELRKPTPPSVGDKPVKEKVEELEGKARVDAYQAAVYTVYEIHVDLDLVGYEDDVMLPYIVSVEVDSKKVIGIYRNWKEEDPKREKRHWFVPYQYVPGLGFYGLGLVHLIGGLSKCATGAMRALIDAGQFANLPAGFKSKGVRWAGSNEPLAPGEWRDVEALGQDLQKALVPLPYKPPSGELFELMKYAVEAGRKFADSTEQVVADSTNYGPVGTTMALLEASGKSFSAIFRRLHASLREELKILSDINLEFGPDQYPYAIDPQGQNSFKQDFDVRIDVVPVSDPHISSSTQRLGQSQAVQAMAAQAPDIHNMREVYMYMYDSMNIADPERFLPKPPEPQPADPMHEHMHMLVGEAIQAFEVQDHDSHIQAHMTFLEDPAFGGNPDVGQKIGAEMIAHIASHYAFKYKVEIESALGFEVPVESSGNPQQDAQIAQAVAQAAKQIREQHQQEMGLGPMGEDPVIQLQREELEIKRDDVGLKSREQDRKDLALEVEAQKIEGDQALVAAEIERKAAADGSKEGTELLALAVEERVKAEEIAVKKIQAKKGSADGAKRGGSSST